MKQIKTLLCAAAVAFSGVAAALPAELTVYASKNPFPTEGSCGENCTWSWDYDTKTLTISGQGPMDDFIPTGYIAGGTQAFQAPWDYEDYEITENIENFVVEEGITAVTGIGCAEKLTNVSLPSTLQSIGTPNTFYTFAGCTALKKIVIPEGVTEIHAGFFNCPALEDVTIPKSVEYFVGNAFYGTPWLTAKQAENPLVVVNSILIDATTASGNAVIPDGVTEIGEYAFANNEELTGITIPKSVTAIDTYAFDSCTALTSVSIPEGVTYLGTGAFFADDQLAEISIPASVDTIGSDAFYHTAWLAARQAENPLVIINGILYTGETASGNVIIPDGVKHINSEAFYQNEALTGVTVPAGVSIIGMDAFYQCVNLSSVSLPEGLTILDNGAFCGCTALAEIKLPESLTAIGMGAFEMGEADESPALLEKITIPANVLLIDAYAFNLCNHLKEITILNPQCIINDHLAINNDNMWDEDSQDFLQTYSGVIRGYDNSTAQKYAEKFGFTFESLGAAPVPAALTGDLDGDGEITASDAQNLLAAYAEALASGKTSLTDVQKTACDIDKDGDITAADAQYILIYYTENVVAGNLVSWDELLAK